MHALHLCVCGPSVCCLTLLTWTVDPRLQAEPGEKKNRLGRPWVCHLFLWTWSVWIRSFCLSPARRHTRTYTHTIPSSFPLAFLCSVFHGASYTHRHSASGCPVCHVPWPCVWTSVQKGLWFQGEKKGVGGGGGVGGGDDGGGGGGGAHIDSYPLATRQEAAFIILPLK